MNKKQRKKINIEKDILRNMRETFKVTRCSKNELRVRKRLQRETQKRYTKKRKKEYKKELEERQNKTCS